MSIKLPEKVRQLIDDKNIAHFATLNQDGSPHVSPVWIDRDGDVILVNTTSTSSRIILKISDFFTTRTSGVLLISLLFALCHMI